MRKLFTSLYILLFISFIGLGLLFDWVWQQISYEIAFSQHDIQAISTLLNRVDPPLDDVLTSLSTIYQHDFSLWSVNDLQLPAHLLADIKHAPIILDDQQGQGYYYAWLPVHNQLLVVKFVLPTAAWVKFIITLVFYACLAAIIWLWLQPLWRDLTKLRLASIRVSQGDLSSRSGVKSLSVISIIANNFDDMVSRIAALIQSHKELTSAVSHEIKTPIARAKFAVEMMSNKIQKQAYADAQTYADSIIEDLDEIDALVFEMLTYAKFEQTQPALHLSEVDIIQLINTQFASLALQYPLIKFKLNRQASTLLMCDGHFIDRVLQNLLLNACKYGRSQVNVELIDQPDILVVAIEDDGDGIAEHNLATIFQPFSRLDESRTRSSGGFGLGLAIVKHIMQWHQGSIVALGKSKSGGARFELQFSKTLKD
ncbi:ATP-binding protein [Algibacillus agarilyticus]|uniref:ATP-binding protein n=1 Tax=Algibacillus agarilyticus TaxID=2234133 RepID=UPI000DD022AA|nr:ATP-binding protein [Algibacillus agarilyticus]